MRSSFLPSIGIQRSPKLMRNTVLVQHPALHRLVYVVSARNFFFTSTILYNPTCTLVACENVCLRIFKTRQKLLSSAMDSFLSHELSHDEVQLLDVCFQEESLQSYAARLRRFHKRPITNCLSYTTGLSTRFTLYSRKFGRASAPDHKKLVNEEESKLQTHTIVSNEDSAKHKFKHGRNRRYLTRYILAARSPNRRNFNNWDKMTWHTFMWYKESVATEKNALRQFKIMLLFIDVICRPSKQSGQASEGESWHCWHWWNLRTTIGGGRGEGGHAKVSKWEPHKHGNLIIFKTKVRSLCNSWPNFDILQ